MWSSSFCAASRTLNNQLIVPRFGHDWVIVLVVGSIPIKSLFNLISGSNRRYTDVGYMEQMIGYMEQMIGYMEQMIGYMEQMIGYMEQMIGYVEQIIGYVEEIIGYMEQIIGYLENH
ncbi:hypothetical protein RRG08_021013 [Elysia crispata]|uniref:Uncharacterized protein n=1 Tax=Elysia crispata TaxID=231223 RepID=A0AAE0Y8L2_9GAST|nr:hypothetical protein RRG08_021013 [Elysia crispata]